MKQAVDLAPRQRLLRRIRAKADGVARGRTTRPVAQPESILRAIAAEICAALVGNV